MSERDAMRLDVTLTHSYERADLVALESPTDYRRGMIYGAELVRAALARLPDGNPHE